MSKSSKIIVVLLVMILIAVLGVGGYFLYKTTTKIEEQNNEISKLKENESNTLKEENTLVNSNKNLNMSIEEKMYCIALLDDFSDGTKLTTEQYLSVVYNAINRGYIKISNENESSDGYSYSESEINNIVYNLFGVNLQENKSYGGVLTYKNGTYEFVGADGDAVPLIKNLKEDSASGKVTFDLYMEDVLDNQEYKGKYQVTLNNSNDNNSGFIVSKKLISANRMEKTSSDTVTENTIKELFLSKIKANDTTNTEKLLDYKVDKVTLIKDDEKQSIVDMDGGQYYKADDTLAYVEYSVKPRDVNSTVWIAGNGEVEGEWIVGKVDCVCIRSGEIVTSGTGW